jgi:hypothetical protein
MQYAAALGTALTEAREEEAKIKTEKYFTPME